MRSGVALLTAALLVLGGCTGGGSDDGAEADGPAGPRAPEDAVTVLDTPDPAASAVATSRALVARSEVVVLSAADADVQEVAQDAADELGAPMLLPHDGVADEVERLGATTVLAVGTETELDGAVEVEPTADAVEAAVADLPRADPPQRDLILLTRAAAPNRAAVTTARSAGATVVESPTADPRADAEAAETLTDRPEAAVVGLGRPFANGLAYQVTAVRKDLTQPGGGYLVFPGRHVVALYGHPGTKALGLLGEQGPRKSVARAKKYAAAYEKLADDPVVPAFEIIATVASASKGKDGDYSAEADPADLEPLVDAAEEAGLYVVIDLQPGRSDFLSQAKKYRELLVRPHVGLALDPEWRLKKKQRHLRQIGSVSAGEVNRTSEWLARLTRQEELPQKMFVLHQFSTSMIRDRAKVVTDRPELSTVIHVDGQGTPAAKKGTWNTLRQGAPDGVHWGWKNFLDEDDPMLTPRRTWKIRPVPDLVTYQ